VLETQLDKGQASGFDFYRDPLNAARPMQSFEETMKTDVADKATVMAAQRKVLESRYTLTLRLVLPRRCHAASRCPSARRPGWPPA
jgi:hypothetical protein